jgi:hypothetical protein
MRRNGLGHVEQDLLEERRQDGVEAAGADVLDLLVHLRRDGGDLADGVVGERDLTPSLWSRAWYCFRRAFSGTVRIWKKSSSVRFWSSTRMGKRPWSSGMRSEGFETWKAPLAMNRMWSVLTIPYFVVTAEPSTMGRRSRWTPSRLTSGPPCRRARAAGHLVDLVDEHDAGLLHALDGLALDGVHVDELLGLLVGEQPRWPRRRASAALPLLGAEVAEELLDVEPHLLHPHRPEHLEGGEASETTSISTSRSSSSPARIIFRNRSRVRSRRSSSAESSASSSGLGRMTKPGPLRGPGAVAERSEGRGGDGRGGDEHVEHALLGLDAGLGADALGLLLLEHGHGEVREVADHPVHVAPDVARPR